MTWQVCSNDGGRSPSEFEGLRVEGPDHIEPRFSRRCRNDFSLAFDRPTVAQFGCHGWVCGIHEKDGLPLWQIVIEVAVLVDELPLGLQVSFGGCRLTFFEEEAVALEPIRHARDGKLDAKKTVGLFDRSLGSWHITSGQNGTQPGSMLLG